MSGSHLVEEAEGQARGLDGGDLGVDVEQAADELRVAQRAVAVLIEQLEELPYVVVPSLDLQGLLEVCEAQQAALRGVRICAPNNRPSNHDRHAKAAAR